MLQSILNLLVVLGAVARRDTDSERAQGIANVLGIAEYMIVEGSLTVQKLQQLTNTVKAMAAEGRNPTVEELAMLRSRSDTAHAAIQDVDLSDDGDRFGIFEPQTSDGPEALETPGGTDESTDVTATESAEAPTGDDNGPPTGSVDDPADNPNAETVTP